MTVTISVTAGETALLLTCDNTMSTNALGQQNRLEPAYTDLDHIWFGKHNGELLQDVPESYLCWLWWDANYRNFKNGSMNPQPSDKIARMINLANYIWNSRNAINQELNSRDVRPIE